MIGGPWHELLFACFKIGMRITVCTVIEARRLQFRVTF